MYTSQEFIQLNSTASNHPTWQGRITSLEVDSDMLDYTEEVRAAIFAFVLVRQGTLTIKYNGSYIILGPQDLHIYAPGMLAQIVEVSPDYRGYFLAIDADLISQLALMPQFTRIAYFPISEFDKPKITLSGEQYDLLSSLIRLIRLHISSLTPIRGEALEGLCTVFCLDLMTIQRSLTEHPRVSTHQEALFLKFLQLVSEHYVREHELSFYAHRLSVTTTYLSRVVRQVSGRTARSFVDYALVSEASRLLRATSIGIAELADRLHFADQSSFTKFFTRLKGVSPRAYRT